MEEDYFANLNYSQNIDRIIPNAEMIVNFRSNGIQTRKSCLVFAEKMEFKGLMQLRITEKSDQRRMYITTVDSSNFHELKQDQSLHVTFCGFIENLVQILQDCQAGKLEICIMQIPSKGNLMADAQYQIQFVEMRSFKNLVHLSLPCRMAPLNVVLFYMNTILDTMQKKATLHEQKAQQLQVETHAHLRHIDTLTAENAKLRESILENKHNANQRHAEEISNLEENLRKSSENHKSDNERNRKAISNLQAQIERLNLEKSNIQAEKAQEQKRNDALSEELAAVKSNIVHVKEQNEKLHAEVAAIKNLERKNEMHLSDARKHIVDLQDKIKKNDKAKADLVADLDAEKKILQTKRQALEMASAEISKANEIILKQNQELIRLKRNVIWRTEVALHQEKTVREKERQLKEKEENILLLQQTVKSLRQEIPEQLISIRKFSNELEKKYTEQIEALRNKLQSVDKENNCTATNVQIIRRK